ncbi:LigA protein [Kutzneria sp. 744]|nr:LigA protein [Kutzneria sp. 744]
MVECEREIRRLQAEQLRLIATLDIDEWTAHDIGPALQLSPSNATDRVTWARVRRHPMAARTATTPTILGSVNDMTVNIPVDTAERSEAEALYDLFQAPAQAVRDALGVTQARMGGGIVNSTRTDESGFWSKALGFGFDEPVTAELMGEVCAFYRDAGTPKAVIQLAPTVIPEDWTEICAKQGITAGAKWVKVVAEVDAVADQAVETEGLEIEPLSPEDGPKWTSVMLEVFGMGDELTPVFVAITDREGWRSFTARLDGEIVTTGTMLVRGETGQCFSGATLPKARGRGGQTAMLAARAQAAREAGCRWLVTETGAEGPGEHNTSLRNMLRLGFEVLYERQNWVWTPKTA